MDFFLKPEWLECLSINSGYYHALFQTLPGGDVIFTLALEKMQGTSSCYCHNSVIIFLFGIVSPFRTYWIMSRLEVLLFNTEIQCNPMGEKW